MTATESTRLTRARRAPRMARTDRRDQLLDVATSLLADGETVTMERLAEAAGVSKALPYAHFDNAEDLLVTLYRRASVALGESVWSALIDAQPDGDLAAAWVHGHFYCGDVEGLVFESMIRPGSVIPAKAGRNRGGEEFVARVLHRFFDVERTHANAIAGLLLGALHGASYSWINDVDMRPAIESALAQVIRDLTTDAPRCTEVHAGSGQAHGSPHTAPNGREG